MANEKKPEGGAPPAAAPPPDERKAVEELQREIVDIVKAQSKGVENLEAKVDDVSERVETLQKELGEDQKAAIERLRDQLEEIRSEVNRPAGFAPAESKSVIERAMENEEFKRTLDDKMFKGWSKFHVYAPIKGLFPPSEQKTTITSSTVGSSTPGILTPERIPGIVPLPRRRLTLRDVLPSRMTSSNAVEFIQSTAEPLVSPQTEGSAKGEAALAFTIATAAVRTLAAWVPATRQVLDDWADLQRFVDGSLLFALKLKEEDQILTGDGTGQNLSGLTTGATAYDTGRNVSGDTKLDTLRHGIAQLEAGNEEPSFLVIHPNDAEAVDLIKDQGSNVGNYVAGDPKASGELMTLWRMSVVKTTAMTSGNFLVGDARQAEIFDRMEAIIDISTEHANFFTENKVAIRVEERIALAIYRTSAFVFGTFP